MRSDGITPRVYEITMCIIEQPNSSVGVRYARVQSLGHGNGVNVQTYIRELRVSHGLGIANRL